MWKIFLQIHIYISYNDQIINKYEPNRYKASIFIYISYNDQIINNNESNSNFKRISIYISYNDQIINPLTGINYINNYLKLSLYL